VGRAKKKRNELPWIGDVHVIFPDFPTVLVFFQGLIVGYYNSLLTEYAEDLSEIIPAILNLKKHYR